jgi:TPR repeat protein
MMHWLVGGCLRFALAIGVAAGSAQAQSHPDPPLDCGRFNGEARRLICQSANAGNVQAQVSLGIAYATGSDVPADYVTAFRLFRLAADEGNPAGEAYLGALYASGRGVPRDDAQAVQLFRLAAGKGNAMAQVNLADMYASGRGVQRNNAEAIGWYRRAAEQGNVDGMNGLAWRLAMEGRDLDQALGWASRAAAANPNSGGIQDTLGWILYRQHKPQLAELHARRAVALEPRCASCQDHLGDILAASGALPEARERWRRALAYSTGAPPDPDWDRAAVENKLAAP